MFYKIRATCFTLEKLRFNVEQKKIELEKPLKFEIHLNFELKKPLKFELEIQSEI